jgi:hypothetical protein
MALQLEVHTQIDLRQKFQKICSKKLRAHLKTIIAVMYMHQTMTNPEENPINWDAIIKSHKGVIASDRKRTGTVIAQTEDEIVISDGVITIHRFIMPKSKVDYYDGSDVYLEIPSQLLNIFEVGNKNK